MKKYLNLSVVATFVIVALSCNVANARNAQVVPKNRSIGVIKQNAIKQSSDDYRVFINDKRRSLYQMALLSGISINELRKINKGYDTADIIDIGDIIVLPADSSMFSTASSAINSSATETFLETQNGNLSSGQQIINSSQNISTPQGSNQRQRASNKTNNSSQKEDKYNLPALSSSDKVEKITTSEELERQVAGVLQALGQVDWNTLTAEKLKEDLNNRTRAYAESYVRNRVHNQIVNPIRSAAQEFLGRFGTAQLQFDVSDQARINNLNLKLFSPLYDSDNTLIFSQLTYQAYEQDRRIGNFGLGQRFDVADESWLLGYNVFLDHDFGRGHNRFGFGLEAWSDYMKLAANYYTPLSRWKDSTDFDNYYERAAKGFDVRFQGYLPSYPHLGASLMFEQYFGDKVALFGKDNLQRDPYAVTVGVDYTPVPLFTIKGEHKQGEGSKKSAKVELTMNYRLGVPLKDQLDPDMVQVARSLKGSRYDLVDRNNFMVLEYKAKKFSIDLGTLGELEEQTVARLNITLHNANGVSSPVEWNSLTGIGDLIALTAGMNPVHDGDLCYDRGSFDKGVQCPTGHSWLDFREPMDFTKWSLRVPSYIDPETGLRNPTKTSGVSVEGRYTIDATLTDSEGNTVTSNTSWFSIKPSSDRRVTLENVSSGFFDDATESLGHASNPAPANRKAIVTLEATLFNDNEGFHDYDAYSYFPPVASRGRSLPTVPVGTGHVEKLTGTDIKQDDINRLNELYTMTAGSQKVTFVNGGLYKTCSDSYTPNCLLVQEIEEIAGDNTDSLLADKYRIKVSTTKQLGKVNVAFKFPRYDSKPTTDIYFSSSGGSGSGGGTPDSIKIFDGDGVLVGESKSSNVIELTSDLVANNAYSVKVFDSNGKGITNASDITWSLVGSNIEACPGNAVTVLPGDKSDVSRNVANLFNVAEGSSYTVRSVMLPNPSYASLVAGGNSGGEAKSLNGKRVADIMLPGSKRTNACAGDQGFKLRIDVD